MVLWLLWQKIFFYGYYDKEYFKNNIKITILLKRVWIKNNFETTVTNYGFKDIFKTFKTTITNGDFLYLKIKNKKNKSMWMLTCIQNISLTNILKWVLFLPFFSTNGLWWT